MIFRISIKYWRYKYEIIKEYNENKHDFYKHERKKKSVRIESSKLGA